TAQGRRTCAPCSSPWITRRTTSARSSPFADCWTHGLVELPGVHAPSRPSPPPDRLTRTARQRAGRDHEWGCAAFAREDESAAVVGPADPFTLCFAERDDVADRGRDGVVDVAGGGIGRVNEDLSVSAHGQ